MKITAVLNCFTQSINYKKINFFTAAYDYEGTLLRKTEENQLFNRL